MIEAKPKPTSFSAVIDLWASIEAAMSDIGASRSQIDKWRRRNSIPPERWSDVIGTAVARENGVTAELMVELAAQARASAAPAEARPC